MAASTASDAGSASGTHSSAPLHRSAATSAVTNNMLVIVISLLGLGLVMAASTGPARNPALGHYRVLKHALWVLAAAAALYAGHALDYHTLRRLSVPLLFVSGLALGGVLIFGVEINAAKRWYRLGSVSIQPSEFFKLCLCLYMADFLAREQGRVRTFRKGFVQPVFIMGVAFMLILKQPDFGTALLVAVVTFTMLFVAGIRLIHVLPVLVASGPLLYYLVTVVPYRLQRILAFLDPWADPKGAGYQIIQSLLALGLGGLTGVGLGNSRQNLLFLPEASNDFVFAIICEELGLVGCCAVLLLFALLFRCGMRVAVRAPDLYGTLLAFGLTLTIGLQAVVNIAVATCSAPTKGLSLPLVSSGGSSLVATMAALGVIMNVASHMPVEAGPDEAGAVRLSGGS
jgi:cell division protein FtsW